MKKMIGILCIFIVVIVTLYLKGGMGVQGATGYITPQEGRNILQTQPGSVLVDVRTTEEFESGHIVGALHLPVNNIGDMAERYLPQKDNVIILYCRSGARADKAKSILLQMGYTKVHNMGAFKDWPYETATGKV